MIIMTVLLTCMCTCMHAHANAEVPEIVEVLLCNTVKPLITDPPKADNLSTADGSLAPD